MQQAGETAEFYAQRMGAQATQFGQEVEQQARIVLDAGRQRTSSAGENGAPGQVTDDSADDLEPPPAG